MLDSCNAAQYKFNYQGSCIENLLSLDTQVKSFALSKFSCQEDQFATRRSSGYLSISSWRKWALGAPTNRFPLVWEKSSNGKWLKTAFEKTPTYRYFARKCSWRSMCFQVRAISSRVWFTYIFAFDSGLFVDRWWLKEVWYAPDFLSNCCTRVPLAAQRITRSPSKRICRGTLSQKTRNWPTCQPVHVHERSRKRRRSFDPAYSVDNLTQWESCFGSKTSWCSPSW